MDTTNPSTPTSPDTAPLRAGVLEHHDPNALVIETNVRTEPTITFDPGFIDSIRANGVLVPVLAWRAPDGTVHVRAGQRRTLAAREAGVATIPVYVVTATEGDVAGRIVEQLVENEHREALTGADRVAAWQQLTLEGLTVASIAKRTGSRREQVTAGITVATSSSGTTLLGDGVLSPGSGGGAGGVRGRAGPAGRPDRDRGRGPGLSAGGDAAGSQRPRPRRRHPRRASRRGGPGASDP